MFGVLVVPNSYEETFRGYIDLPMHVKGCVELVLRADHVLVELVATVLFELLVVPLPLVLDLPLPELLRLLGLHHLGSLLP